MIKPDKNPLFMSFLNLYFRFIIWMRFKKIVIETPPVISTKKAVLLVGNHISWWDGILINEINRRFLKKDLYVIMLEKELRKNRVLTKSGAFSINRKSRDIVTTFQFCKKLLKNKETLLLFYPQGKIESMHKHNFTFEKGISRLLGDSVDLIFYACFMDYYSDPKPTLYFYFQNCALGAGSSHHDIQKAYNEFFRKNLEEHCRP